MEIIRPENTVEVLTDDGEIHAFESYSASLKNTDKKAEGTAQDKEKMDETIPF